MKKDIKLFKHKCASDFDWLVELENEGLIKLNFPAELYSKKAYLLFSLECEKSELDDNKFRFKQSKESIKEYPEKIKENRNKMNKLNKELNKIIKELEGVEK